MPDTPCRGTALSTPTRSPVRGPHAVLAKALTRLATPLGSEAFQASASGSFGETPGYELQPLTAWLLARLSKPWRQGVLAKNLATSHAFQASASRSKPDVCVCVCVCVYAYVGMHVHMHVCVCVYVCIAIKA